jgi:DNA-binding GntR family transcriptional regulator
VSRRVEVPSERAADRAYRLIRGDIVSGGLPADSRLGETALGDRYGLSRTPVREALRRLQSEGLVEVSPHRGARVFDWRRLDIEAIYDLRAEVEGFLVRRAAMTIKDDEIERLAELCDQMEEVARELPRGAPEFTDRTADMNQEFHGAIARAAGGELFAGIRNSVVLAPLLLRTVSDYTPEDQERTNHHHREMLAAFRARSSDWAESVMLAHVYSAKSRLLAARAAADGPDIAPDPDDAVDSDATDDLPDAASS